MRRVMQNAGIAETLVKVIQNRPKDMRLHRNSPNE